MVFVSDIRRYVFILASQNTKKMGKKGVGSWEWAIGGSGERRAEGMVGRVFVSNTESMALPRECDVAAERCKYVCK